jgi:peptidoglycan/xylan/chitin deacetylase (PgdA/CDA1 family)
VALYPARDLTLDSIGRTAFFEALRTTSQVLSQALPGAAPGCFRPPDSALDAYTRIYAEELGYDVVLWDVDAQAGHPDAAGVAAHVLSHARPGAVVRFQVGDDRGSATVAALAEALPVLADKGYIFETACRR